MKFALQFIIFVVVAATMFGATTIPILVGGLFGASLIFEPSQVGGFWGWVIGGVLIGTAIAVPVVCGLLAAKLAGWLIDEFG